MLEKLIQANTVALEALTAAISKGSKPAGRGKPKQETANDEIEDPPVRKAARKKVAAKKGTTGITIKAVSDLLLSVCDIAGRDVAVEILAEFGAKQVKKVAAAKFPALAKKLKAALVTAKEAAAEEAEDEEELEFDEEDEGVDFDDEDFDFEDDDD